MAFHGLIQKGLKKTCDTLFPIWEAYHGDSN